MASTFRVCNLSMQASPVSLRCRQVEEHATATPSSSEMQKPHILFVRAEGLSRKNLSLPSAQSAQTLLIHNTPRTGSRPEQFFGIVLCSQYGYMNSPQKSMLTVICSLFNGMGCCRKGLGVT